MQSQVSSEEPPAQSHKQSGYGVASLVIGLVIAVGLLSFVGALYAMHAGAAAVPAMILVFCGLLSGSPIGIVLGLIGVFQRGRAKTAAIIGLVLNGLLAVPAVWLMVSLS